MDDEVYMSEEVYQLLTTITDASTCNCGHGDLPKHWHLGDCPNKS